MLTLTRRHHPRRTGSLLRHIVRWRRNVRSRRHLGSLDPHLLRDIGISHTDAMRESRKWFWIH
ncbi:MAG: DUF1127 domain-containing protein [Pseudomonadota bacterium]